MVSRHQIADQITNKLGPVIDEQATDFAKLGRIEPCKIEALSSPELAHEIHRSFPPSEQLMLKHSLKENKHVGAQMNAFAPILEEVVYAFQDARIVKQISRITALASLEPYVDLYSGEISSNVDHFQAAFFQGAPGQLAADDVMRTDNALRTTVLTAFGNEARTDPHVQKRDPS